MTYYFTSITMNYFAKARVLAKSLKKFNPDVVFCLAISGNLPKDIDWLAEPFDNVLHTDEIDRIGNKKKFSFKHTITELCTAVKPLVALELFKKYNADSVIYLDPDIAIFDCLTELEKMFDTGTLLLTPHQLVSEKHDMYVRENEILFLKRGSYNLGFFGVKNNAEGNRFLEWWSNRLLTYCFDDNYDTLKELTQDGLLGLFTDQKWIDLVPSFFENYYIIREPGYNVSTWNLSGRHVELKTDGKFTVNNKKLFFFHFSGFDSGGHQNELKKSLELYPENKDVKRLSNWYMEELIKNEENNFKKFNCIESKYSNSIQISNLERKIFHIRKDVHNLFQNPFDTSQEFCFYNWVRKEYPEYFRNKFIINICFKKVIGLFFPHKTLRRSFVLELYNKFISNFHRY